MHTSHNMIGICTTRQPEHQTMSREQDLTRAEMLELPLHSRSHHSSIGYDGAGATYAGGMYNQAPGLDIKDTGHPCRDRCEPTLQKMYTELVVLGVRRTFCEVLVVSLSIVALTRGLSGLALAGTLGALSTASISQLMVIPLLRPRSPTDARPPSWLGWSLLATRILLSIFSVMHLFIGYAGLFTGGSDLEPGESVLMRWIVLCELLAICYGVFQGWTVWILGKKAYSPDEIRAVHELPRWRKKDEFRRVLLGFA